MISQSQLVIDPMERGLAQTQFVREALLNGSTNIRNHNWATDERSFDKAAMNESCEVVLSEVWADGEARAFLKWGGSPVYLNLGDGAISVKVAAENVEAELIIEKLREIYPPAKARDLEVPFTFWTYSGHGPQSYNRRLTAVEWDKVRGNYEVNRTLPDLEHLMRSFDPSHGGQLLLWHGEPGTGKTFALRALSWEWRSWCNPPEAPVWMADGTFRNIGNILVGEKVVGWEWRRCGSVMRRCAVVSEVLEIQRRIAPELVEIELESGRKIRCTPDHKWARWYHSEGSDRDRERGEYQSARLGTTLLNAVDVETPLTDPKAIAAAGYLGGIIDGEGHISHGGIVISQSPTKNPEVCARIEEVLNVLDLTYSVTGRHDGGSDRLGSDVRQWRITGGRRLIAKLRAWDVPSAKVEAAWWGGFDKRMASKTTGNRADKVVGIREVGPGDVVSMKTTSGNYVVWGYGSKNCDFHYIADPEEFFGRGEYLLQVLLNEGQMLPMGEGDTAPRQRWRCLILEDTGEMLVTDAKEKVGQGLARLLNTVDGLIGQGLRVLVLVTTNEELGKLHAAITRPGRCAVNTEFLPLGPQQIDAWLEQNGPKDRAFAGGGQKRLADLFALVEGYHNQSRPTGVGF